MITSVPLVTGTLVGNRFILDERIGRGDLGAVFRARDLRKLEARDLNPRVAIKIFHEEFRRHPNAMRVLLREARKAQGLSHPNIVKVYDFDRDGPTVYMTMEHLEGESLDRVIKSGGGVGLGFDEALRITRDVCDAMSYAHASGILHTDFKPANVFLTHKGIVKVLDFGLARAVRREDWADRLLTLFDSGALNALSPAYSGCEVTEGMEPDVRDDIYAIACVFYELLTGKHPFDGSSAEEASREKRVPVRPANLSRSAWRVLSSALEFRRDRRPASAMDFLEGLLPRRKAPVMYLSLTAAACVAIVSMLAVMHVMTYRAHAVSAALASDNASQIEAVMPWLRELSPERRASILSDKAARAGLFNYFMRRVDAAVDPKRGPKDSAQAEAVIKELWNLLPDSQAVNAFAARIGALKSSKPEPAEKVVTPISSLSTSSLSKGHSRPVLAAARVKRAEELLRAAMSQQPRIATSTEASAQTISPYYMGQSQQAELSAAAAASAPALPTRAQRPSKRRSAVATESILLSPSLTPQNAETVTLSAPKLDVLFEIANLKQALLRQAAADRVNEAVFTLGLLREKLPEGDEFLVKDGPEAISSAYLRLGSEAAKNGKIEEALNLAIKGSKVAPERREAAAARDRYLSYYEIDELLRTRERILSHHVRYKIWRVSKLAPEEMPAITQRWERDLAARIQASKDQELAAHLSKVGQAIFGSAPSALAPTEPATVDAH
jgi:serine/threonine protein kinase